MKKIILSLFLGVFLIGLASALPANDSSNNVYRCGEINAGGSYILNQTITVTNNTMAWCINFNASNINLNCNFKGIYNLTYTPTDYGLLYIASRNNITIRNCLINGSLTNGFGVYATNTNNTFINNSIFYLRAPFSMTGDKNRITNNYFRAANRPAVTLLRGNNNYFGNNIGISASTYSNQFSGTNTTIVHNILSNGQVAIQYVGSITSQNSTIFNNTMSSVAQGIILTDVLRTNITNNLVSSSGKPYGVYFTVPSYCNNTFTNNYEINTSIIFEYYYRQNVNIANQVKYNNIMICNSSNAIINNITFRNASSSRIGGLTIGASNNVTVGNVICNSTRECLNLNYYVTNSRFNNISSYSDVTNAFLLQKYTTETTQGNNTFTNLYSRLSGGFSIRNNMINNTFNNVYIDSGADYGVYLENGGGRTTINNLTVVNTLRNAVYVDRQSNFRLNGFSFYNNSGTTGYYPAITITGALNNTVIQNGIMNITRNGDGIVILGKSNNNTRINNVNITGNCTWGLYLNNTITNVFVHNTSYVSERLNGSLGANANNTMWRSWYYQARAVWANGTVIPNAVVYGNNTRDGLIYVNNLTDANGLAPLRNISAYFANATRYIYYTTRVNVTFNGTTLNHTYNATRSYTPDDFTFGSSVVIAIFTQYGSPISWIWSIPSTTLKIKSGSPTNWTWTTYSTGSGRKTINGTATNWSWINE